jgi:hypothetical protein
MEKSVHSERAERFFLKEELLFKQKRNESSTKVTENPRENRAFENLSAHFGCAENHSSIPKRTECCK